MTEQRRPQSFICALCGSGDYAFFSVPSATWRAAVPTHLHDRVLCGPCFMRFADENGVSARPDYHRTSDTEVFVRTADEVSVHQARARTDYVLRFGLRLGLMPPAEWCDRWWPTTARDGARLRAEVRECVDELARSASKPSGLGYDEREVDGYTEALLRLFGHAVDFTEPRCRYCGADCSDGRSWDGGDLYACPACADRRAATPAGQQT